MPVQAVVFDVYGTLLDVASLDGAAGAVSEQPAELVALWRAKQLEYSFLTGLMGQYRDFWALTGDALDFALARHGISLDPVRRDHLRDAWLTLAPHAEVVSTLAELASRGHRLAVLSNGTPTMLDAVLAHAGIRDRFAPILSVDAARTFKPSPTVYRLVTDALGLPAGDILFVSANGWDAVGAAAFGFSTAWINRRGAPRERHGPPVDYELTDLTGLIRVAESRA